MALPSIEEMRAAVAEHGTAAAASRALGLGHDTVRRALKRAERDTGAYEMPAGHVIRGESALVNANGEVVARWIKTREGGSGPALIDGLREAFADLPRVPELKAPEACEGDTLTIYPIPDLHFGMYAWAPETGADYDTEIAARIATETLAALVAQSRPSKRAVLLGLGDYFHANDQTAETPRSRHRLDVDGRWAKVYAAGARLMRRLVEMVAARHAEVDVVILPGNHDEDAAVTLRVALELAYENNPRIRVYDRPGVLWCERFGANLIAATHGHTMKPVQMALAVAVDFAREWGATEHRYGYQGHIHHETAKEVGGMRVESFGTPAPRDAYAQNGGYRSGRSLQAITLHAAHGEVGRHRVNITTARAA